MSQLGDDVLDTIIADYADHEPDYLPARAVSTAGLAAVRRVLRSAHFSFMMRPPGRGAELASAKRNYGNGGGIVPISPRAIAASISVFGACRRSISLGAHRTLETIDALSSLVAATNGRLRELHLIDPADWAVDSDGCPSVSVAACVELCRGAPLLEVLFCRAEELSDAAASELGALCPLLKRVEFHCESYSPAETWAKHFPSLESLCLRTAYIEYRPTLR